MNRTYSFSDYTIIIGHPSIGQHSFQGEGIGGATVAYAKDMTAHDSAADGVVMISKIVSKNGTATITTQQTSEGNKWLKNFVKYLRNAPTSEFALGYMLIYGPDVDMRCNGLTPQKPADTAFQESGQQVSWSLMVAEIVE